MKIAKEDFYKITLLMAVGFYLSIVGFGADLLFNIESGIESSRSGNRINQVLGLAIFFAGLFILFKIQKVSVSEIAKMAWPLWALLVLFSFSITWSYTPNISVRRVIALITMVFTCLALVKMYTPTSLLNVIANAIVLTVVLGLITTVLSGQGLSFGLSDRSLGFRGIFGDKNGAARVYTYGLLLFIGLGRYQKKRDLVCLSLLVFAVLVSQSATAVVMAVMGTGLIVLFNTFKGKAIKQNLLRFIVLMALLLLGSYIANIAYEFILSALGRDPTLTNRAIIWELIDPLIVEELLLGYGYGAFWLSEGAIPFIERWGFIGNAHSGYREIMLHSGIVGLGALLFLLAFQLVNAIKLYIAPANKKLTSLLLMMVIIQAIINYIGYIIINHNSVDMFLFLICFFIICNENQKSKQEVV
ncbi:O-antigen ligase family protein [Glaciecola siphonariae]|uniref:O-antigen ligase family protein n=1 Tax=Glaciecola siphonariae TaxID=521012 RepID=A0ABV9M1A5_9ALTE